MEGKGAFAEFSPGSDNYNGRAAPHGKDFKAGSKDYHVEHLTQLEMWNNRLNYVVPDGEVDPPVFPADDPYVLWYERITVRYISRLGAAADTVV